MECFPIWRADIPSSLQSCATQRSAPNRTNNARPYLTFLRSGGAYRRAASQDASWLKSGQNRTFPGRMIEPSQGAHTWVGLLALSPMTGHIGVTIAGCQSFFGGFAGNRWSRRHPVFRMGANERPLLSGWADIQASRLLVRLQICGPNPA